MPPLAPRMSRKSLDHRPPRLASGAGPVYASAALFWEWMEREHEPSLYREWSVFETIASAEKTAVDEMAEWATNCSSTADACDQLLEELLEAYLEGEYPYCVPEVIGSMLDVSKSGLTKELLQTILNKLRTLAKCRYGCDAALNIWCIEAYRYWIESKR